MKRYVALALCASLMPYMAIAQLGRHGGGQRVQVQNRSANMNRNGNMNRNTNVNRNVNVNQNVNVNRNVNVNNNYHGGGYYPPPPPPHGGGCYNCGYYDHDDGWNWGSFAAGAAVAATTTAVVAAATRPSTTTTVVTTAPVVGTVVPALPGTCSSINSGGVVMYNCSNIYYRPFYQGTTLVYQVVTYP